MAKIRIKKWTELGSVFAYIEIALEWRNGLGFNLDLMKMMGERLRGGRGLGKGGKFGRKE